MDPDPEDRIVVMSENAPGTGAAGGGRTRCATLPMYAEPELRPAVEHWWTGVARHFRDRGVAGVPGALTWANDRYRPWRSPDLLFSQTCGQPLVHSVGQSVQVVATPHYGAPGCEGPTYRSFIVIREDEVARSIGELRGKRLAVNGLDSWSGYRVWRWILVGSGAGTGEIDEEFGDTVVSGSHRASIRSVREGCADLCAVDCVSYALLGARSPAELAGTRVLGHSPPQLALPFITAASTTVDELGRIRAGLFAALGDPGLADARAALLLTGASVLTESDYRRAFDA